MQTSDDDPLLWDLQTASSPRPLWLKVCADSSCQGLWSNHGLPASHPPVPGRQGRRVLDRLYSWNDHSLHIERLPPNHPKRQAHARDGLVLARQLQGVLPSWTVLYTDQGVLDHLDSVCPGWYPLRTPTSSPLSWDLGLRTITPAASPGSLRLQIEAEHGLISGLWQYAPTEDGEGIFSIELKDVDLPGAAGRRWVRSIQAWNLTYAQCLNSDASYAWDWIGHALRGLDLASTLACIRPDLAVVYADQALSGRIYGYVTHPTPDSLRMLYEYPVGPIVQRDGPARSYRLGKHRQYPWRRSSFGHISHRAVVLTE